MKITKIKIILKYEKAYQGYQKIQREINTINNRITNQKKTWKNAKSAKDQSLRILVRPHTVRTIINILGSTKKKTKPQIITYLRVKANTQFAIG